MQFIPPQLCKTATELPTGPNWSYEDKLDGYRALASINDAGDIRIFTRRGHDWTDRFPRLVAKLHRLHLPPVILDGELVALGTDGRPDFRRLGAELHHGQVENFVCFDLLAYGSEYLITRPLNERRHRLHQLVPFAGSQVTAAPVHFDGASLLRAVEDAEGEGIVAKELDSPYLSGERPRTWLKLKLRTRCELVVIGWRCDDTGKLKSVGLASDDDGTIRSRGWVGAGFTEAERHLLPQRFAALVNECPPAWARTAPAGARWLKPELRAEIRCDRISDGSSLRGGVFLGLREDLAPSAQRFDRRSLVRPPIGADRPSD